MPDKFNYINISIDILCHNSQAVLFWFRKRKYCICTAAANPWRNATCYVKYCVCFSHVDDHLPRPWAAVGARGHGATQPHVHFRRRATVLRLPDGKVALLRPLQHDALRILHGSVRIHLSVHHSTDRIAAFP